MCLSTPTPAPSSTPKPLLCYLLIFSPDLKTLRYFTENYKEMRKLAYKEILGGKIKMGAGGTQAGLLGSEGPIQSPRTGSLSAPLPKGNFKIRDNK